MGGVSLDIYEIIWRNKFIEKLASKHNVSTDEVEEVLFGNPFIRFWEKGDIDGEDLYLAYGQTDAGRYLVVFFIRKPQNMTLPISARDMTNAERRYYNGQK